MITFAKITSYSRGTLARLLRDAYSFDPRWNAHYGDSFDEFDRFFYDNPNIADNCGFITLCEGEPIGHISWDPRGTPEVVRLGHNCIATRYKRRGYGRAQLLEALRLITERCHPKQIVVTTSASLIAARRNYEGAGFILSGIRKNREDEFTGDYYDYELTL